MKMRPAVFREDFWGDLANTFLLRPVYRETKQEHAAKVAASSTKTEQRTAKAEEASMAADVSATVESSAAAVAVADTQKVRVAASMVTEVERSKLNQAIEEASKRLGGAAGQGGQHSRLNRRVKEQVLYSRVYIHGGVRRKNKEDFRRLWIQRINAAARANGLTYNRLIQGLKAAEVEVDRRTLAELAVSDANAFAALVNVAKAALPADTFASAAKGAPKAGSAPAADRNGS